MSININPPNFSGTASIAGRNINNTALTVPGALGLEAYQAGLKRKELEQRKMLELAQLRAQELQGIRSNHTQNRALDLQAAGQERQGLLAAQEMAFKQQELGQRVGQNQSEMDMRGQELAQRTSFGQGSLEVEKQKLFQEQQQREMAKLMDDKKESIHEKGAFASYARLSMDQAKTPESAQLLRTDILKEAVTKGHISEEEAKMASKTSISQFKNMLGYKIMQYGAVKDFQSMQPEEPTPAKSHTGMQMTFNEDGSIASYSSNPTTPVKTKAQNELVGANQNVKELKAMFDNVPDNFFGASAYNQSATWAREWAEKVPLVGTMIGPDKKDKKELEVYNSMQSQTKNQAMTIIKELSGLSYTDKQLEFMNEIVPNIGPGAVKSEFTGKSKNLIRFFEQVKKDRQDLLSKGIELGSPEYEEQMRARVGAAASSQDNDLRLHLKSKGHSEADIDAYLSRRQ